MLRLALLLGAIAVAQSKVTLRIHGTAGCTDTVWFIQNQLLPVAERFGEEFEFEFIPWGRTVRNENGGLTCQFGINDCWANRVQRCALSLLQSQRDRLGYLNCEYASNTDRPAFLQGTYTCAALSGINLVLLDYCVAWTGEVLDQESQVASVVPMQVINFVPALVVNGVVDLDIHWASFYNLGQVVCNALVQDPESPVVSC